MNEVERSEFPIESAYGDRFRFRFLRHSSRGDRVVRMRLVQLLEVRHFSTLSPSEEKHKFSISHVLHVYMSDSYEQFPFEIIEKSIQHRHTNYFTRVCIWFS